MSSTLAGVDRQPQATIGNHTQDRRAAVQREMPFLSAVPAPRLLPPQVVVAASFCGVLADAARGSGMDDHEIADAIHVCPGYMSRFMRAVGQQWAQRLVRFCRTTGSLGPVQWMADQLGCDLVPRDSRAAEVAELQARLRELQGVRAA